MSRRICKDIERVLHDIHNAGYRGYRLDNMILHFKTIAAFAASKGTTITFGHS